MSRIFAGLELFQKNFALSIGPQRAGTGWIERYLRFRGDVCLPQGVKEVFFFDRHYGRGGAFYRNHFSIQSDHKLGMEITTTIFDHSEAPMRVVSFFGPTVKLICPLRHPVERSYSQYLHMLRYGLVRGGIAEAVEQAPQILNSSRYAQYLENWYRFFSPENIILLYQEDMENSQEVYAQHICEALGLRYMAPPASLVGAYNATEVARFPAMARALSRWEERSLSHGAGRVSRTLDILRVRRALFGPEVFDAPHVRMTREEHEWLSVRLVPEIERFESLLGAPIAAWRRGRS